MANDQSSRGPTPSIGQSEQSPADVSLRIKSQRGATVVSVSGELDASNIHRLRDCVQRLARCGGPFVLDLTGVDFLTAQGIRVLFGFDEQCRDADVKWALVPGRPVSRLLRICDIDGRLPIAHTINDALRRVSARRRSRHLLQLIP